MCNKHTTNDSPSEGRNQNGSTKGQFRDAGSTLLWPPRKKAVRGPRGRSEGAVLLHKAGAHPGKGQSQDCGWTNLQLPTQVLHAFLWTSVGEQMQPGAWCGMKPHFTFQPTTHKQRLSSAEGLQGGSHLEVSRELWKGTCLSDGFGLKRSPVPPPCVPR